MGLADTNRPDEQKASGVERIFLSELACSHASRGQGSVRAIELEVGQLAVLVALGDTGGVEQGLRTGVKAAVATRYAANVALGDGLPSRAFAERAGIRARGVG